MARYILLTLLCNNYKSNKVWQLLFVAVSSLGGDVTYIAMTTARRQQRRVSVAADWLKGEITPASDWRSVKPSAQLK